MYLENTVFHVGVYFNLAGDKNDMGFTNIAKTVSANLDEEKGVDRDISLQ